MPVVRRTVFALISLIFVSLALSGCGGTTLLSDVEIRPAIISPNADGTEDIAEIKYSLSRTATVTITLRDEDGHTYVFRDEKRRSKGDRTAYFSGVIDGRLLPDGDYAVLFETVDDKGRVERDESQITLVDGDKVYLEIQNLNIWPNSFTPNRDGITDRVTIAYNLNKEVDRVEVYLLDQEGNKYPVPEDEIREAGAVGTHEHDYDAGIDLGAVPPDNGEYTVVVDAVDYVGNRAQVRGKLTIEGGGLPMVEIVNRAAQFSPDVLALGGRLTFTCTVKNIGTVPVRTKGPESGTVYRTDENYNSMEEYEEPGLFRVGLDYEGNSAGRIYPFRWQLGRDDDLTVIDTGIGAETYLMPDQTVTVVGHLDVVDQPVKTEPYYWLGLIHEQVWIVQDRVEPTQIAVGF